MTHLKTIEGSATLIVDGDEVGLVEYSISVFKDHGLKRADGRISGDQEMLMRAFEGRSASLLLSNSGIIEIGIRNYRLSDNWAEIAVLGPVPGV